MHARAVVIEAAVDTAADAERAVAEGADRIELCAALDVGGLTPADALVSAALALPVPSVAMVRPRAGDFVYSEAELATMLSDVRRLVARGLQGVVFGCLNPDNTINERACARLVGAAGGAVTVFHRAFDHTPDAHAALESLVSGGVSRVLTSGQARTAVEGAAALAGLVAIADGRIAILAGGGVRAENARRVLAGSRVRGLHARGSTPGIISQLRTTVDAPGFGHPAVGPT